MSCRATSRPAARGRGPERRQEGGDPGRRRRAARHRRTDRGGRAPAGRHRQGLLGKAALPDDLPWVTGSIGILGTKASWDMMTHCDTLLMIGTGFPYAEFLPEEGKARAVQIDIDADHARHPLPAEVNLVGDSAATLRLLLPLLKQKEDSSWRGGSKARCATGGSCSRARAGAGQAGQSAARVLGTVAAAAGRRHRHQRLRLLRQLVRARPARAARADVFAVRRPGLDGLRRCRTRSPPSSRIRAGP
jgi:hypothetical protein